LRVNDDDEALEPKGKTLPELVREQKYWETRKRWADKVVKRASSIIHKIAVKRIPPLMEAMDQDDTNIKGVARVRIDNEVYVYVKAADVAAFHEWLRERGDGALIKPTIHHKTLNSWGAEMLGDPEAKLPDYINITEVPTAKLLKETR
jgi:hypothetical protein